MKKLFAVLTAVFLTATLWAQSPEKMSYQAVIRNSSNALVTNQAVGMQISILQGSAGGTAVYVETQTPTTNAKGLVSIEIGAGTIVSGNFATIDWANDSYFIKTETDPAGGTSYSITGTSQLLSVPYALHSKTAETVTGGITETDPLWSASPSFGITNTNISNWNTAFGWGNHATAGYLTSFTETDPVWIAASSNYYTKTNMQTSGQAQLHFNNITNKPTTLSGYGITDAFDGTWASLTGKPTFATVATSGSYNDLSDKPTIPTATDGSETKVTAGTNVTVTGSGTTVSPYVINSTGGGSGAALILSATNTNAQSVAAGNNTQTPVDITFNSYSAPSSGSFNGITYTVGTSGVYLITASTASSTMGSAAINVLVNGNPVSVGAVGSYTNIPSSFYQGRSNASVVVSLSTNDEVKIIATNINSSVAATLSTDGTTRFTITKL